MANDFIELANDALVPRTHNEPPLEEMLAEEVAPLIDRRDALLASAARAPAVIADEETSQKIADLIRLIAACIKAAEAARIAKKEPFLAAGRLVDATYRKVSDPLDKEKRRVEATLTAYQRQKAEEERRVREAEARRQAEEAERQRRAAEAAAAALQTEADLDAAVTAEALAREAAADALHARQEAEAKPAELSRTRGDLGAVASLATVWKGEIVDRDTLDLEILRPFIPVDGLERALNAYVRSGGRELRGARVYQFTATRVR